MQIFPLPQFADFLGLETPLFVKPHTPTSCAVAPQWVMPRPRAARKRLVIHLNAHGRAQNSVPGDPSLRGHVCELPGRVYAEAKVAPSLCSVIRQLLEGQQVSVEVIQDH